MYTVPLFQFLNHFTGCHAAWYERNSIGDQPVISYNFRYSLKTTWRMCKLMRWKRLRRHLAMSFRKCAIFVDATVRKNVILRPCENYFQLLV
jgi:hypothetical protein